MIPQPTEPIASEIELLLSGKKIEAIKQHRARTLLGLKESKDAIEAAGIRLGFLIVNQNGLAVPKPKEVVPNGKSNDPARDKALFTNNAV